jgi:uncharacterized delta-60 repeat protein
MFPICRVSLARVFSLWHILFDAIRSSGGSSHPRGKPIMSFHRSRQAHSARGPAAPMIEAIEPRVLFVSGDLDLSFGAAGSVSIPGSSGDFIVGRESVNGKTYVATARYSPTAPDHTLDDFQIIRLGETGDVEQVIGNSILGFSGIYDGVGGFAVQPDGKILVTTHRFQFGTGITRLTADGQFDPTFSGRDANSLAINNPSAPLILPDGRIVVGGSLSVESRNDPDRFALVRLDSAGNYDPTFGGNGLAVLPGVPGRVTDLALQKGGKLIVGGQFTDIDSDKGVTIIRLNANGTHDQRWGTFGSGALGDVDSLMGMSVAPNGDLVYVIGINSFDTFIEPYRVSANGSKKTAYERFTIPSFSSYGSIGTAMTADGTLLLTGGFSIRSADGFPGRDPVTDPPGKIVAWNADGSFDNAMGGDGFLDAADCGAPIVTRDSGDLVMVSQNPDDNSLIITRRSLRESPASDGIRLINRYLSITGTKGNDRIRVQETGDQVSVRSRRFWQSFATADIDQVFVNGSSGNDRITVEASSLQVRLNAGSGNDFIDGGSWVDGGDGDDRIVLRGGEYAQGGWGSDTIDASYVVSQDPNAIPGRPEFNGNFSDSPKARNVLTYEHRSSPVDLSLPNLNADYFNIFHLTPFADTFSGGGSSITVDAGAGNDAITVSGGPSILIGGAGNDLLSALNNIADGIIGGPGNDAAFADLIDKLKTVEAVRRSL